MKDLDFDELDRAVSSILGAESVATPQPTTPSAPEASPTDTVAPAGEAPVKKTLVEKRSAGRFMDVVHPSSDMKNLQKPAISRQAAPIAPPVNDELSLDVEPSLPSQDTPAFPAPEPAVTNPAAPAVSEPEPAAQPDLHTLPDPLDFQNFSMNDTPEVAAAAEVSEPVQADADEEGEAKLDQVLNELDAITTPADSEETAPIETPFVGDSAVEKRPLGAFSAVTDTAPVETPDEEAPAVEDTEESEPQARAESEASAEATTDEKEADTEEPAEAQGDLNGDTQLAPEVDTIPAELENDVVAVEQEIVETPESTLAPETPAGGSIPQQYAEKTLAEPAEQTPVFDTNQYHQPLKHPVKKKSGWLSVVLIIFFILLGVGAGAAIYFFDPFGLLQ